MKTKTSLSIAGLALSATATAATLTSGHVDFIGLAYDGTEFEPHSHVELFGVVDGQPIEDVEYAVGDLIIEISATTTRNSGIVFDPIGVAAGEKFWLARQTATSGEPYVGFGLEELVPADWAANITLTLTSAVMPADAVFALWQGNVTPTFSMSTADGLSAADAVSLAAGSHTHYNWGFTKEGTYDLTFAIAGAHSIDGAKSATATYTFSVIPEPSVALLAAIGALELLRRRRN